MKINIKFIIIFVSDFIKNKIKFIFLYFLYKNINL